MLYVVAGIVRGQALGAQPGGRHQRRRRVDLSRGTLLGTGALAGGSLALWALTEGVWRVTGAPGARRSGTAVRALICCDALFRTGLRRGAVTAG